MFVPCDLSEYLLKTLVNVRDNTDDMLSVRATHLSYSTFN